MHWEKQFEVFINIYGIWHILRQNIGFLKLYRKRGQERLPLDAIFDFGLMYASVILLLCFRVSDRYQRPLEWIPLFNFSPDIFLRVFWALVLIYIGRQLYLLFQRRLHFPKLYFVVAIIATYYFTYVYSDPPLGLLVAIETIYHDVQYHGWIGHFQKRRFGGYALQKWLLTSLGYGILFGAVYVVSILGQFSEWLLAPFYMLVLFHYFIDARIWRFSKSPELKAIYG